ncbi:MAG: T9SS type A sorting domain-containing protein [Bacteroidetes bacterium]|nr:T9SS type A sorting domain-containing protein [Bacteroidota bacterium]
MKPGLLKLYSSLLFLISPSLSLFAQNSGSWIPVSPVQGDTITIVCDPKLDSQTAGLTVSSVNLYWGVNGSPGSWSRPDASYWPTGTSSEGGSAVQTPMIKSGDKWQIKIKSDKNLSNILFLFRVNGNQFWLRNNNQDYNLKVNSLPQSFVSYSIMGNSVRVQAQTYFMTFSAVKDNIVKIAYDDSVLVDTAMLQEGQSSLSFTSVDETDSTLEMATGLLKVTLRKPTMTSYFSDQTGSVLLNQAESDGFEQGQQSRGIAFRIKNEALYGMGEKGIDLNRRNYSFNTYNRADGGYNRALSAMKINIPFLTTTGNYALFFDNEYPADVDLKDQIRYSARGGFMTYYFIAGDLKKQLKGYHELTGYQPLPPKWAFGFIQSKYGYKTETEVKAIANSFRTKGIPADAIILDLYWFGVENSMGNLSWNTSGFPNPTKFVADMKALGFKIIPIQELYLITSSRLYSPFSNQNLLGKTPNGNPYVINGFWAGSAGLVDITNPAAQQAWWNESKAIMNSGISGWWTDLGEPESHPSDMIHFGGKSEKVHNVYNLLWAKTLFDGFNTDFPNQRFFNLTRSGTAGMQRYATFPWSGDVERSFNGFALQPKIMLGMSLSGIGYESSDLGGFTGPAASPELYTRWLQFGAFNGIMRAHTAQHDPEPWRFGDQAQSIVTDYIKLRYSLFPYLYTLASKYTFEGEPIIRPLIYDFPNDPNVVNMSSQFMVGPDILVVPILKEGQVTTDVYLPEGNWIDYFNPKEIYSTGSYQMSTPLSKIPVFVREGAIIPKTTVSYNLADTKIDTLNLFIALGSNNTSVLSSNGEFYEDDGNSLDYKNGQFITSTFSILPTGKNSGQFVLTHSGAGFSNSPEKRTYILEFPYSPGLPMIFISDDGLPVTHYSSFSEFKTDTAYGFYFDAPRNLVLLKTTKPFSTDWSISFNYYPVSVSDGKNHLTFKLAQNYPNPFNPTTNLSISIPFSGSTELEIFNLLGQKVKTIHSGYLSAGIYDFQFDGSHLPSGVYFARLKSGTGEKTIRMVLMK